MLKQLLTPLLVTVVCITAFGQSAWNKKKNEGFFKLGETIIVADDFYDLDGKIVPITTTGVYITSLYGEYGITDRLTGFIYFPFFFRNTLSEQKFITSGTTAPGDELNSVGDTDIGISYGIKQNSNFVLNVSLLLGLPTGETSGGNTQLLQSGDGEFNQMLRLGLGYSFYPKPVYIAGGVGFNNRTNDFSDELHISAEVGITLKKFNLALKLYDRISLENGAAESSRNGIFSNNIEYFAFGPEVSYSFKGHWGLSATYQGALSGRNILASPSYTFGVFYKL